MKNKIDCNCNYWKKIIIQEFELFFTLNEEFFTVQLLLTSTVNLFYRKSLFNFMQWETICNKTWFIIMNL